MARQFATLDHLSDGRAGWNMVTRRMRSPARTSAAADSSTTPTGTSAPRSSSPSRASSGTAGHADAVVADRDSGVYVDPDRIRHVEHHGAQFDVRGVATLPPAPQGHPVLLQAGDSATAATFGAKHADAMFTLHSALEAGQKYYADVKGRAASYGRDPNRLKVFPAATFVLGDTAGGSRRQGAPHPLPAGQPADRDRDARTGLAARPVGL